MEIGFRWLLSFLRSFRITLHLNCLAVRARPPYKIVVLLVQDPTASFWFATSLQERGFYTMKRAKERRGRNQLSITTGQTNFFSGMWNDATRRDLLIFYPPSFFIASFCCVFLANDYERVCPKCQATAAKRCWQISYHFHALLHTKLYVQGVSYRMFSSRPRVCVFVVLLICRLTFFPVCLPWSLLKVRHFFFLELLAEICFALLLLLLLSN